MVKKKKQPDTEETLMEAIAAMPERYRALGQRLHEIIRAAAPELTPKLWYGMPGYARNGKLVVFFRGAEGERFMTLGFQEAANLDEGGFWPTSYALTELTPEIEKEIEKIVQKAARP